MKFMDLVLAVDEARRAGLAVADAELRVCSDGIFIIRPDNFEITHEQRVDLELTGWTFMGLNGAIGWRLLLPY